MVSRVDSGSLPDAVHAPWAVTSGVGSQAGLVGRRSQGAGSGPAVGASQLLLTDRAGLSGHRVACSLSPALLSRLVT